MKKSIKNGDYYQDQQEHEPLPDPVVFFQKYLTAKIKTFSENRRFQLGERDKLFAQSRRNFFYLDLNHFNT